LAFIPGGTAEQVLQLTQNYSRYADLYKPDIQNAKIVSREGHHFHVYYRLCRHAIVTVVYDAEFGRSMLLGRHGLNEDLTLQ
jgi:hypothetical protein